MTGTSDTVYSTTTSGTRGHVAHFEVEARSDDRARYMRTVVHLPDVCQLVGKSSERPLETKFYDDKHYGFVYAHSGEANEELLAAAKVFTDSALKPFNHRIGVRAVVTDSRVALIGYINRDIDLDAFCQDLADVIYEEVADVDVRPIPARPMGARELEEWRDHQLIDY